VEDVKIKYKIVRWLKKGKYRAKKTSGIDRMGWKDEKTRDF